MKVGLVLEGGGMRGMYTAGVLDVLLDEAITINGILSVSAGALFGVNFPSKQKGRSLRYNLKYLKDKRYMGLRSLLTSGNIVNKNFAYYEVSFKLDPFDQETFAQSGIDFYATLTNLATGQAEYHLITDVFEQMEVLRASSALPIVSKPVTIDDALYLDGGIADPIPVQKAKEMGYDKVIVILTRPLNYQKKPSSSKLYERVYRDYPQFVERWKKRAERYNETVAELNRAHDAGEVFVIRPSRILPMGRLEKNPAKLKAMYDLGQFDMCGQYEALGQYLQTDRKE